MPVSLSVGEISLVARPQAGGVASINHVTHLDLPEDC